MDKTNNILASTKGMTKLERAKFGPGMLLQDEDLELLNSYTRDLSRLLFKSFFGCGVICGLVVTVDTKCGTVCVTVGAGVALACSGDPVAVPKDQSFVLDENCDPNIKSPLWVVLCGTTKQCAPRTSMCAADDDEAPSVPTRERDGFEIRVVRVLPQCICGCPDLDPKPENEGRVDENDCKCVKPYQPNGPGAKCYDSHYDGKCGCSCDECSDCDCKCILLAQLIKNEEDEWYADHRGRRFIRPILMRDPQVEIEEKARKEANEQVLYYSKLADVDKDRAEAYKHAADAIKAADRALVNANMAADFRDSKIAAAQAVKIQLDGAQEEAKKTAKLAKAAADKLAKVKGAASKAAGDKTTIDDAQAEAEKMAALAQAAANKLVKLKAEAEKADAEEAKAVAEADAAEAEARKAEENRANAYLAAADAAARAAKLMKE